uniref:Jacalin-type lectin domain-containing protein n=1 Tax=Mola mola TaxID=94237 RepID=A0A3Q3W1K4_MOLML
MPTDPRTFSFLVLAVLCASCLADFEYFSFSPAVGYGRGSSFALTGNGKITAIRLWERSNSYITGIQLSNNHIWSQVFGHASGSMIEMKLYEDEIIIQVSGKYHSNYIYQLTFVTSRGRSLVAGQPYRTSFNMYPVHKDAGLIALSGRYTYGGITTLAAHWGLVSMDPVQSTTSYK